jgi:hypothetical protein
VDVGGIAGTFLTLTAQLSVGGVAAMLLVPMAGIGIGFYRTTTPVFLGLMIVAVWMRIWLLSHALSKDLPRPDVFAWAPLSAVSAWMAFTLLVLAFWISLWGTKPRVSRRLLWAGSVSGLIGLAMDALPLGRFEPGLMAVALLANSWLSSGLLGLTFTGMLLGHWYLNEPGLPTRHVWRMAHWFLVAVILQGLFPAAYSLMAWVTGDRLLAAEVARVIPNYPVLFGARIGIGIGVTLVVAVVIRNTLKIPNVQSATGFFYIAILTVLLGEVLGRALRLFTGLPF